MSEGMRKVPAVCRKLSCNLFFELIKKEASTASFLVSSWDAPACHGLENSISCVFCR